MMAGRGFCVKIQLDLHAITCPGVWLCPNGKTALQIRSLNSTIESRRLLPVFPLLFHDRFTFKKVFAGIGTLTELQNCLRRELVYAELIQWTSSDCRKIVLATFETNLVDLLYPAPCSKGLLVGVDVDLLMEPTKHFPGIIAPKIEVSTRTTVEEVLGISGGPMAGAHIVNPKTIYSKNLACCHKRRPVKGIIRQRKVCHSQGKQKVQSCRPYCQKFNNTIESPHLCSICSDRQRNIELDRCYHMQKKNENCLHEMCSPMKICDASSICDDLHMFDSCPVCLKYKCYFSGHYDTSNVTKNLSLKRTENGQKGSVTRCDIDAAIYDKSCCACRPNSAPNPQDNCISVLRSRMKTLQKNNNCLHHTESNSKIEDVSEHNTNQFEYNRDPPNQCFYKNLEKFYKRMYKQARKRAQDSCA